MRACWTFSPNDRISFRAIVDELVPYENDDFHLNAYYHTQQSSLPPAILIDSDNHDEEDLLLVDDDDSAHHWTDFGILLISVFYHSLYISIYTFLVVALYFSVQILNKIDLNNVVSEWREDDGVYFPLSRCF